MCCVAHCPLLPPCLLTGSLLPTWGPHACPHGDTPTHTHYIGTMQRRGHSPRDRLALLVPSSPPTAVPYFNHPSWHPLRCRPTRGCCSHPFMGWCACAICCQGIKRPPPDVSHRLPLVLPLLLHRLTGCSYCCCSIVHLAFHLFLSFFFLSL